MDFEKLLQDIKQQVLLDSKEKYKELLPQLEKDLDLFLKLSEEKLKRWTILLLEKSLTKEELEWLLKSQQNLLEMNLLLAAGISKIKVNNLKNKIIKTIIETTAKAVIVAL